MRKDSLMRQLFQVEEAIKTCLDKGRLQDLEIQRDNIEDNLELADPTFFRSRPWQ